MAALLAAMAAPGYPARCVLVASNRPDAGGLATAAAAGVATAALDHRAWGPDRQGFERALSAEIEAAGARLVCLAGFMRVLTPWFVGRWRNRLLNIHPSLLPAFPGLDTHARALAAGVAAHGCTVHLVREAVDDGPILGQAVVDVRPGDDPDTLAARVLAVEHRLYPAALAAFARGDIAIDGDRPVGRPLLMIARAATAADRA
jgi:phosphoribosylglycinamide formyltransferase-1